jgi:DeoR/GlpR family transcriptional regulator of sugar metabolism
MAGYRPSAEKNPVAKPETAAIAAPANRSERLPAALRQARILASFQTSGFVSITELAAEFGVSGMTVRRDLAILDSKGLLERTHGGAVPVGVSAGIIDTIEPAFDLRRRENAAQKIAIARAAAQLIGPSESIGLDVGTSIMALAEDIAARRDIRVFTNNLRVALRLAEGSVTVYTLAGQVRSPEFSIIGPQAVEGLAAHFLDRVFIGVAGLDANGFYDYSPEDTEVKRAFIDNAGSVVVLCDASKFGRRALSRVVPLARIDHLVTDSAPPDDLARALAAADVNVIIAG